MTKKLICCLLTCNAAHAMHINIPALTEPLSGAQAIFTQLLDVRNTEADIMQFLESFEDFDEHVDVNELIPTSGRFTEYAISLLHKAVDRKFNRVIKFLIRHGADVNIRNAIGWTPLGSALCNAPPELGSEICDTPEDNDILQTLLASGANQQNIYYHPYDTERYMALAFAIEVSRNSDVIKLLCAYNADPNELSPWGITPLANLARSFNRYDRAQVLLAAGADPTWQDANGDNALSLAICCSTPNVRQALLQTHNKSRAQVLAELNEQKTNLCAASLALETTPNSFKRRNLRKKCIPKYLLTQTTDTGETPLVTALRYNSADSVTEIVKCLTYREIVGVIAFAKQFGRYNILLQALAAPENYESVMQEAIADNNQKLVGDLQKTAITFYHRGHFTSMKLSLMLNIVLSRSKKHDL